MGYDCVKMSIHQPKSARQTRGTNHLRYPLNVVIARADEAHEVLPWVLPQHADPLQVGGLARKIGVSTAPARVAVAQVHVQLEVIGEQGTDGLIFGGGVGSWGIRRRRRGRIGAVEHRGS